MTHLICDLDGVIWTGSSVSPNIAEAFYQLSKNKIDLVFISNNSFLDVEVITDRLQHLGAPQNFVLVTSSIVTASTLPRGSRIYAEVGPGTINQLKKHGHSLCQWNEEPNFVVMGLVEHFDYQLLTNLMNAVINGAQLVGTNDDPTFPTNAGYKPGGGSLLSSVATAAGVTPIVMGKPHESMVNYVSNLNLHSSCIGVVGDRFDQDGKFAVALDLPFFLVESTSTAESKNRVQDVNPHLQALTFVDLVDQIVIP
jgi:HAD superfamily hydrolase (TIGR01450 family)